MPKILHDDGSSALVQTDDGRQITIPSATASQLPFTLGAQGAKGFGAAPTMSAPPTISLFPENDIARKNLEAAGMGQGPMQTTTSLSVPGAAPPPGPALAPTPTAPRPPIQQQSAAAPQAAAGVGAAHDPYAMLMGAAHRSAVQEKGYEQKLDKAAINYNKAQEDMAVVESNKAQEQLELAKQKDAREQELNAQHQTNEVERADARDRLQQQINEARADVAKAPTGDQRGMGHKIGAAVAVALGAIGAAIAGGPNHALEIVQADTERRLQAQREELGKRKEKVGGLTNDLGRLREQFGDDRQAEDAFRIRELQRFDNAINQTAMKYGGAEAQAKAQETSAANNQKIAELQNSMFAANDARVAQRQSAAAEYSAAMGRAGAAGAVQAQGRVVPGVGLAVSDDAAKKAIEMKNGTDSALDSISKLQALRAKHGGGFSTTLHPEDAAQAETIQSDFELQLKNAYQLGVLSASDLAMVKSIVGNPTAYGTPFSDKVKAKLDTLKEKLRAGTDQKFKNYGLPGYTAPGGDKGVSSETLR